MTTYHAAYENRADAERAVNELRNAGIPDRAISVIAKRDHLDGDKHVGGVEADTGEAVKDVVGKTAAGAGIGALLGIGALAIPGVGPLVAAGAIAEVAAGGAAVTGTAVGAAAGGIAGLLSDHGVEREDADYYERRVNEGDVLVLVDGDKMDNDRQVDDILYRYNGTSARRNSVHT
ncbi:general stress protein [Erythrobacter sp.]|jgi:uncharacterized membrane protein|uniref:general stress protein n=1 Tax=Erythrobacter sp. TaxID=1042 RepID=UPI002EA1436F|nr:general stress protein [Erythrobacter sp.]